METHIWAKPNLIAALIVYSMADEKLREEYNREMTQSLYVNEVRDDAARHPTSTSEKA